MPDFPLTSSAEVAQCLEYVANALLRDQLDLQLGYTVSSVLSLLMKALERAKFEKNSAAVDALRSRDDDEHD
jgi:hypothetical protein